MLILKGRLKRGGIIKMQEHVELEVSLEIIMAEIANCMFNLKTKEDEIN